MIVDTVLANAKAYVNGKVVDCCLAMDSGMIFRIGKEPNMPKADKKINLGNRLVLPGLIDAHVHLRDERKAHEEDFYTGTAAAAAGGFTTILDMPNNDPVTMSAETLRNRMKLAEGKALTNVGFLSEFPREAREILTIVGAGAVAFKLYTAEQIGGLDIDDSFALCGAFKTLGRIGIPLALHAEDKDRLKTAKRELTSICRNDVCAFVEAHSEDVETRAIERMLNLACEAKTRMHFCHISSREGLEAVYNAKQSERRVTCETTPHNLLLSFSDLVKKGSMALTMPPVREEKHIEALWNGLKRGWIDIIASDHAPHTLEDMKTENVWESKVGISGLETTLPLLLTQIKRRRLSLTELVRLMAEKPAEIFGLKGRGRLREGNIADFTIVDLDAEYEINSSEFHSKAKFSPFDGWRVAGRAVKTIVHGQLTMDEGQIVASAGSGHIVRRE